MDFSTLSTSTAKADVVATPSAAIINAFFNMLVSLNELLEVPTGNRIRHVYW